MKKKLVSASFLAAALMVSALASCTGNPGSSSVNPGNVSSSKGGTESSSQGDTTAPVATGVHSYVSADYEAKGHILGKLEKYAIDNMLTGMPLYDDGGLSMYQTRVTKGTEKYVQGYGFSVLRDGSITGDLEGETVAEYKRYLHTYEANDPNTIAALNNDGQQVSDLNGYIAAGYYSTRLNASKDGYEWYGYLTTKKPAAVKDDGTVLAYEDIGKTDNYSTWRYYVRTGEKGGVNYRSGSSLEDRKKFDGTFATLDDYVYGWKALLNGANNFYRGTEFSTQTGKSAIVGVADYYNLTKKLGGASPDDAKKIEVEDSAEAKAAWDKVGIKSGKDETGDYIQITWGAPLNRFYAMYQLSDTSYAPVPQAFFRLVGASNYENSSTDKTTSPVDNTLAIAPYYLASWETDQTITFKRNENWWEIKENPSLYTIPGIHVAILKAAATDSEAAFNEFLANRLDSVGVPTTQVEKYRNDPRTVRVPGGTTYKLNMNTTTQEMWNSLFGDNGSVKSGQDNGYAVKPWMSNENFLKGLFFSIDRNTYAEKLGRNAALTYFGDSYLIDPEEGLAYNSTQDHQEAMEDFWGDTISTGGFNLSLAEDYFTDAISELEAAGSIPSDGKLTIDIWWQTVAQATSNGQPLAQYMQDAFNAAAKAAGKTYTLTVNNNGCAKWSDVYYKHLLIGKFDLGFGSISGNALDPLNFMEVLKSDNSSGFTLNWGCDTSEVKTGKDALVYDGMAWSFDSLWNAADHGVLLDTKGISLPPFILPGEASFKENEDGTATIGFTMPSAKVIYPDLSGIDQVEFVIDNIWLESYSNEESDDIEMDSEGHALSGFEANLVSGSYDWSTGEVAITIAESLVSSFILEVTSENTADYGLPVGRYAYFYFGMSCGLTIDGVTGLSNLYTATLVPLAA